MSIVRTRCFGIGITFASSRYSEAVVGTGQRRNPQPTSTDRLRGRDTGVKLTDIRRIRLHLASQCVNLFQQKPAIREINHEDHRDPTRGT